MAPIRTVRCPFCTRWVSVDAAWNAIEALWMHEYECDAIVLAS